MPRLRITDGKYFINDLVIPETDLAQLRPSMPLLPEGIVSVDYDQTDNIQSDGFNESAGPVPWPEADALLADAQLPADYAASLNPPQATPSLAEKKASAIAAVDTAAETARNAFLTPGSAQAMVYEQKGAEAVQFQTDNNPQPGNYPLLAAEVGITASDLAGVATIVLAKRNAWLATAAQIEAARLGAKKQIASATDAAAIDAIVNPLTWPAPT